MFTGLIEQVGRIAEIKPMPGGFRLRISSPMGAELAPGDSVAVNGVCLTMVSVDPYGMHADVAPETARVTTLGSLQPDAIVNLERPLRADARLGGHFVQGHVDAVGTIDEIRQEGESYWLTIAYPSAMSAFIVRKGSIAVDGISLTVAGLDERFFDVQVIPFTWAHTNIRTAKAGDPVNLEFDILGKYVGRAVEAWRQSSAAE